MRLSYSSYKRTTEHHSNGRSITEQRSRQFNLRTSTSRRQRSGVEWGTVIVLLAKVLLAVAEGLLGTGNGRLRLLPESNIHEIYGYPLYRSGWAMQRA